MQERYVVTMNLGGGAIHPQSRASLKAAAERWGANYLELTEAWGTRPAADVMGCKLEMDLIPVPAGARVAYIDGDCLVRSDCPDVFDMLEPGELGVVASDQGDTHGTMEQSLAAHEGHWNRLRGAFGVAEPCDPWRYFNGGVQVWLKGKHDVMWRVAREGLAKAGRWPGGRMNPMDEQTAINLAAVACRLDLTWLGREWNRLGPAVWDRPGLIDCYVAHYANIGHRNGRARKWAAIEAAAWVAGDHGLPEDGHPVLDGEAGDDAD